MITNVANLSRTKATPDAVLMERIAAGNRLAMQLLYSRLNTRLFRFALRMVGDEAEHHLAGLARTRLRPVGGLGAQHLHVS